MFFQRPSPLYSRSKLEATFHVHRRRLENNIHEEREEGNTFFTNQSCSSLFVVHVKAFFSTTQKTMTHVALSRFCMLLLQDVDLSYLAAELSSSNIQRQQTGHKEFCVSFRKTRTLRGKGTNTTKSVPTAKSKPFNRSLGQKQADNKQL